ncbi:cytochrome P450 2J4-like [Haliotis cracherodii]|uniref:cytochrome P450 2J4-like n=1 Tax=Haliotis cracherodii TaxID=6455 RepID=UPI0039E996F5
MGSALSTVREYLTPASERVQSFLPPDVSIRTVLVFSSTLLLGYLLLRRDGKKRPPGPFAFPVVGNMPQMAGIKDVYRFMMKLRLRYGDVFRLKIGPMTTVVVCGPSLVRDTLVNKGSYVINRPNWIYIIDKIFKGKGVFWSNGDQWRHMRKFAVVALRNLGVGKRSLEERIFEECSILIEAWEDLDGRSFNVKPYLANAVANIICNIVFGERFEYTDKEFKELLGYLEFLFKNAGIQVPENFFPWIRYIRGDAPAQKMINNDKKLQEFVVKKVNEHRVDFDPDNLRDFIDLFLKTEQEGDSKIAVEDVFRTTVDLFLAGSEATSVALQWFLLYMARFPDTQQRCLDAVKKETGGGRPVSLADKDKLTYIVATLNEVLRLASVAPLAPPHSVVKPVEIGGYNLDVNDLVMFHLYSCHMDPEFWTKPEVFRPERWIDEDGKIIKNPAFMPFGAGPRTCLGEPLVMMELFLFAANLLQRFEFRLEPGAEIPSLEGHQDGITNRPLDFGLQALARSTA